MGPRFSPSGHYAAMVDVTNHSVRVCESETGRAISMLGMLWAGRVERDFEPGRVRDVVFAPDERTPLTTATARQYWCPEVPHRLRVIRPGTQLRVEDPPPEANLKCGGRIWDVQSGRLIMRLIGHDGPVEWGSFTGDGKSILTTGADGSARLWDALTGECCFVFGGDECKVHDAFLVPDGRQVVTTECVEDNGEKTILRFWVRQRPEQWWGIGFLPSFWGALALVAGLIVGLIRWRRSMRGGAA